MRMLHLPMRAYFPSNSLCSNDIKYTSLPIITINAPAQLVAQPRVECAAICTYVNLLWSTVKWLVDVSFHGALERLPLPIYPQLYSIFHSANVALPVLEPNRELHVDGKGSGG